MKSGNIVQEKSFKFAVKIINIYKILLKDKKEFVLSKQLLKCGTSIGANIEEAIGGQSEKDFFAKITIAYKETRETIYWIKLLKETDFFTEQVASDLLNDAIEIAKLLTKIQLRMKEKISNSCN